MKQRGGVLDDARCAPAEPPGGSSADTNPRNSTQPSLHHHHKVDPLPSSPAVAEWNTRNLGLRIGADVTAAACAGALVAPLITMIDRGIIENASGRNTLGASIKASLKQFLFRPHRFIFSKPFGLIFTLYTGTYLTANAVDTLSATLHGQPAATVTAGASKFVATSAANLGLCIFKDARFARLFAASPATPRAIPPATYALFTLRDCLTVFASFNVPPRLAPLLAAHQPDLLDHLRLAPLAAAQFLAPAAVQLVSTPLHLLGLDLFNRPGASAAARAAKVARDWPASCLARMGRIVPAFGVGGIVNLRVRAGLMGRLD